MKKFMKKVISIIICVCMIIPTTIPATITAEAGTTETVLNGAIHFGIGQIPYVGKALDGMFGPLITKSLGIPSLGSLSKQLKEISAKIDKLSIQIDENHNELLAQLYKDKINNYNNLITSVKAQTSRYYMQLSEIEKDFDPNSKDSNDKYLEAISIAEVSDGILSDFSTYLNNLNELYYYITGTGTGMREGLLVMIYKANCSDAALAGEAGIMANDSIEDIVACIQNAYYIASLVLYSGIYVADNPTAYESLAKDDPNGNFSNYKMFEKNKKSFAGSLNLLNKNYGDMFGCVSEGENENYYCDEVKIDSEITDGVIGDYNKMLKQVWFYYINKTDFSVSPAVVEYIPLDTQLMFNSALPNGYENKREKDYYEKERNKIEQTNSYKNVTNKYLNSTLTNAQIKKIITHFSNNEYLGTAEDDITLEDALKNYGFDFANIDKYAKDNNLPSDAKKIILTKFDVCTDIRKVHVYNFGPDLGESANLASANFEKKNLLYNTHYEYGRNVMGQRTSDLVYESGGYSDIVNFYFQKVTPINSLSDFKKFEKSIADGTTYTNEKIVLNVDLDLSKYDYESVWQDSNYKKEFCGIFEGNNHTIKNFSFTNSLEHRVALFRTTGEGAVIRNLNFENINISGAANKNGYAAVIGYANGNTTIDNVTIKSGKITGYKYVAGMIGESNRGKKMTITNCTNNATITSTDTDAAGMIANSGEIYISNCINNGAVTANKGAAGGISGYLGNRDKDPYFCVENCKNTASITGDDCTAGICANLESDKGNTKIIGNENTGAIKNISKRSAGGIVGRTYAGGLFKDNKNSGNVENLATSNGEAGGILGYNQDDYIKIENNLNSGNITAVSSTGGIAGWLGDRDHDKQCDIIGNSNSGEIKSSSSDAGGIIGVISTDNKNHQVSNNSNTGYVAAERQAGGIVGYMAGGGLFESNKNRSNVTSNSQNAGGIVGSIQDDLCEFKKSDVDATAVVGNQRMIDDYKYLVKAKNTDMHAGKICGWDGKRKSNISSDTLSSSIFGAGSAVIIVSMVAVLVAGGVVIAIVYKKRKQNVNLAAE